MPPKNSIFTAIHSELFNKSTSNPDPKADNSGDSILTCADVIACVSSLSIFWKVGGNALTAPGFMGSTTAFDVFLGSNSLLQIQLKSSGFITIGSSIDDGIVVSANTNSRILYDSAGVDSVYWGLRNLADSASVLAVNWSTRSMYNSTATLTLDWQSGTLNDPSPPSLSLNWFTRQAFDTSGLLSMDYTARILYDGSTVVSVDWQSRVANDASGVASVYWDSRVLFDSSGITSVDWAGRSLRDTASIASVFYDSRILADSTGVNILWWSNGNVGINQSAPTSKLHVTGTDNSSSTRSVYFENLSLSKSASFYNNGTWRILGDQDMNVDASNPDNYHLQVKTTSGAAGIAIDGGNFSALRFFNGGYGTAKAVFQMVSSTDFRMYFEDLHFVDISSNITQLYKASATGYWLFSPLGTGIVPANAPVTVVGDTSDGSTNVFSLYDSAGLQLTRMDSNGNWLIGSGASAPASMADGILLVNSTPPSSNVANGFSFYSDDVVAGNAAPHFRTEAGNIIRLFTSAAYTPSNVTTDRSYDADSTTVNELADVLGTLIADLQATGIIG
jgi:hypothetical protein